MNNSNTQNKFIKTVLLMTFGATFGLLRYAGVLAVPISGALGLLVTLLTLCEPIFSVACALCMGSLAANKSYAAAVTAVVISVAPGTVLAISEGNYMMLIFAFAPVIAATVMALVISFGADRSMVTGGVSLALALSMTALCALALNALAKANSTDFQGLVSAFTQSVMTSSETVFESEQFAVLSQNYGVSKEALKTTYIQMLSAVFGLIIVLLPGIFYALYSLWAYFLTAFLDHTIDTKMQAPEIKDLKKRVAGGEIHIRMVKRSTGYDNGFNVSLATALVFDVAFVLCLIGTLFGLGKTVVACAALFVIALMPTFLILGYKSLYKLLRPHLGSLTIPVIAVASLVLSGSGVTFVVISMLGSRSARRNEREIRSNLG